MWSSNKLVFLLSTLAPLWVALNALAQSPAVGNSTVPGTPGVLGSNSAGGDGVFGDGGGSGRGVVGVSSNHTGLEGNSGTGIGVYGASASNNSDAMRLRGLTLRAM
jgi:hypothetical protein